MPKADPLKESKRVGSLFFMRTWQSFTFSFRLCEKRVVYQTGFISLTYGTFRSIRVAEMSINTTTVPNGTTLNYDYGNEIGYIKNQDDYVNAIRMLYIVGYIIICTLGLVLNPVAIIAGICSGGKTDTAKCVLAIAVTHLICSAFLPWQALYSWYHFNWHYGTILCKLSSYVLYVSMFSTAGILTIWSVHCKGIRCLLIQNTSGVLLMVLCSLIFATILSIPSLYSRELRYTGLGKQCIDDFDFEDTKTTLYGRTILTFVVWCRFLLGIVIPAFLIGICCCCLRSRMEKNLKKIKCLVITAYFVCWTPLLFMGLLQDASKNYNFDYALPVATVLAAAHCCINPVIYLLMSPNYPVKWLKQVEVDQFPSACI